VSDFAYMCLVATILKGAKQSQTKIKKKLCPKTLKMRRKSMFKILLITPLCPSVLSNI
jgi:hypothetical protein